jgi:hypothetical protein
MREGFQKGQKGEPQVLKESVYITMVGTTTL